MTHTVNNGFACKAPFSGEALCLWLVPYLLRIITSSLQIKTMRLQLVK